MKKVLAGIIVLIFATLACVSGTPTQQVDNVSTIVASTMQALTQNTPTTQSSNGVRFDSSLLTGTLPYGLGTGVTDETTAEMEFPICANPSCGDTPSHHRYTIQNYQFNGSHLTPEILVFDANEFASFAAFTPQIIADLQSLKSTPHTIPDSLIGHFGTRSKYMTFQNGYGAAYFSQPLQGIVPINNTDLFYYFQGLTDDGKCYVSAILPISAPFLLADSRPDSPLPAGAVPFDWQNPGTFDLPKYYDAVAEQLNTAAPDSFMPSLSSLDSLIQSLQVTSTQAVCSN